MTTVTVRQLWRFPVKSMGGTPVDEVRIDRRGVHADRLWAVRDLDNDVTASGRRLPALLKCTARYVAEPGGDAGPGNVPPVLIDFPDGSQGCSTDTDIDDRLSEVAGRPVRLTPLPPESDTSMQRLRLQQTLAAYAPSEVRRDFGLTDTDKLPDTSIFSMKEVATLARFSTPPGTFVDLSPVHLLSTTSMTSLSGDGEGFDARRFRPNVLVDIAHAATDFPGGRLDRCPPGRRRRGTASQRADHPLRDTDAPTAGHRPGPLDHPAAGRAHRPVSRRVRRCRPAGHGAGRRCRARASAPAAEHTASRHERGG